jgi:hypothetical protein
MAVEYAVELGDVTKVRSDLLILKYARHFYGADGTVAQILDERGICPAEKIHPELGWHVTIETHGVVASSLVMFIGAPCLRDFRYREIRQFARQAIEATATLTPPVRTITTTVHGAGYGLDIEEALHSMIFGFQLGLAEHPREALTKITFVEMNGRRAATLESALRALRPPRNPPRPEAATSSGPSAPPPPPIVATPPADKKVAFVAMPFCEDFEDVWEFGIYAPIRRCGYTCEKVDVSAFAGDIVGRIREGIRDATFVVADLTMERPNVYLEVGYAWGLNKPVILVAREGQKLHFDLSHHKCIFYKTIGKLAQDLERLVREVYGVGSDSAKR